MRTQAGLTTADVNWPCTRAADSLDDSFPDVPEAVGAQHAAAAQRIGMQGILSDETDKSFSAPTPVGRDDIWTRTACYLIQQRRPNLLLLHLLNVDAIHHNSGLRTLPGYTAIAYAYVCARPGRLGH